MLTEHMDVSLGDGVEAAAGQKDDVGFGGFCHGFLSVFLWVPVRSGAGPVFPGSSVVCSRRRPLQRQRERGEAGESAAGGGRRQEEAGGSVRVKETLTLRITQVLVLVPSGLTVVQDLHHTGE